MQFIVPGLIMMAVITNAYSNVAASFYGAKFQRSIEELLVALCLRILLLSVMSVVGWRAAFVSAFW